MEDVESTQILRFSHTLKKLKSLTEIPVPHDSPVKFLSHVRLFVIPWTVAYHAPPFMEFSRQEYWKWVAISRGSSRPKDQTQVSCIADRCFTIWATREALMTNRKFLLKCVLDCSYSLSSIQFSDSVMSDSLQPHELQHARPPCPSPTPGAYPNSCPLSQRCHPTISSSVVPFSFCPQSFPALGSFQMSQFFASGGQSTGVSTSTSVFPMNTQDWSPLGWTGGSPCSPRDSQVSSPTPHFKSFNS